MTVTPVNDTYAAEGAQGPCVASFVADKNVAPGTGFALITPGASLLPSDLRALYIGTAGTIDVVDGNGHAELGVPVAASTLIPVCFTKITAATATVYGVR